MYKSILLILISCFMLTKSGAQTVDQNIKEQVIKLFVFTDEHKWDDLKNVFADKVLLDYSSFTGAEVSELTPDQIIQAWSGFLPGFNSTQHQIGNFLIEQSNNKAKVFCYGTASHYFPNDSGKNVWTVVGTYDFELSKTEKSWKVNSMKFNFKYQDGNIDLPKLIQNKNKEKE